MTHPKHTRERSEGVVCPCGSNPCRVLPLNGGALWFYDATRSMSNGDRMVFRAGHADPRETRSLTHLIGLAASVLFAQQPHLARALGEGEGR